METIEQIKIDEGGYQAEVYLCSAGKLTWLYGRNITDRPILQDEWLILKSFLIHGKTQEYWANHLFYKDIADLKETLSNGFYSEEEDSELLMVIGELPEEVKSIIVNMMYNMGTSAFNPWTWPNFFKAIKQRNWKQAATEGRDSRWFRQVGQRSIRLMNSLEKIEGG